MAQITFELTPVFDSAKSFYKKAHVRYEDNKKVLVSYTTDVATIDQTTNTLVVHGSWGATTTRHIKEFALQNDFYYKNKKQMENDYMEGSN